MTTLTALLHSIERISDRVLSFEFRPALGQFPAFTAGAHIDVHLPDGLVRSYSLTNPQGETHRYVVAVQLELESRGGSKYLHEYAKVEDAFEISAPRNHFPLREHSPMTVLIAGGIGVTPIWAMVQRLEALGAPWELHYAARAQSSAPYAQNIEAAAARASRAVTFNFDGGSKQRQIDLRRIVETSPSGADFYCCGPTAMIEAFEAATYDLPQERVHREYFAAPVKAQAAPVANDEPFEVEIASSQRVFTVQADESLLEALQREGIEVPHSCSSGICGTCETGVLAGEVDHRDYVGSPQEMDQRRTMMVCCSRAKSPRLTLAL